MNHYRFFNLSFLASYQLLVGRNFNKAVKLNSNGYFKIVLRYDICVRNLFTTFLPINLLPAVLPGIFPFVSFTLPMILLISELRHTSDCFSSSRSLSLRRHCITTKIHFITAPALGSSCNKFWTFLVIPVLSPEWFFGSPCAQRPPSTE